MKPSGTAQNLRQSSRYRVAGPGAAERRIFHLVIGTSDHIEQHPSNSSVIPSVYELEQNFPNPFNPATTIRYALPQNDHVTIKVYNLAGKEIATLVDGELQSAGYHTVVWDGRNPENLPVASGIYVYRMQTDVFAKSAKMILVK